MISTCEAKVPSWPNHPLTTSVTVELQKGQKKFNDLEKRVTEFAATCPSRSATKSKSPFKCILPTLSQQIDVYGDH